MKSSFAARRKPRAIAREDDEEDKDTQATTVSAVKRPNDRLKKLSSRQTSFTIGASSHVDQSTSDHEADSFVLKRSNLSRQAIARNAQRKAGIELPEERLVSRQQGLEDDGQPIYSSEALALLKKATPVAPGDEVEDDETTQMLRTIDIAAKFGVDYSSGTSGIPTNAEIAEKKERRARLAKEIKYNANGSGSEDNDEVMLDAGHDSDEDEFKMQIDRVQLHDPRSAKYAETRLVRDDEDILEGFDEFTNDSANGRIEIGRKAEKAARKRAKEQMRALITEAEGHHGSESDESERERMDVYEDVQKQKAIGATPLASIQDDAVTPRLPQIPTLSSVLDKLRAALEETSLMLQAKQRDIEDIEQERREIAERESDVQRALSETAEQYQRLRVEAGLKSGESSSQALDLDSALALGNATRIANGNLQRGLEDLVTNGK